MERQWRSIEEFNQGKNPDQENSTGKTSGSRRDFLKLFGFSVASAAVLSSCEKPVQKAIPYLIKPEEISPGKAAYYASSFYDGTEYCSVLVKVRDGRPIKIGSLSHQKGVD